MMGILELQVDLDIRHPLQGEDKHHFLDKFRCHDMIPRTLEQQKRFHSYIVVLRVLKN